MCGIVGIYDTNQAVDAEQLDTLCDLLTHRGPDDRGTYCEGGVGLAMRRLSIIDLESGQQPIFTQDKRYVIVYNGEVYNFQPLREELEAQGHQFSTSSDTEVILHLYQEYGADSVARLEGMFAFAVWDTQEKELFICRDHYGIKPLFFEWQDGRLVFGSELKIFHHLRQGKLKLDFDGVVDFFTFLFVPGGRTLLSGVSKLEPGHFARIKNNELTIRRFYDLPDKEQVSNRRANQNDTFETTLQVLRDSVRKHMISDVPLGAFLSGGVDSTLIVGLMSEISELPVETFSIGYDEAGASFDEREFSTEVSKILKTNHHELIVTPKEVISRFPEILQRLDEPIGDASVIPNYLLSEFAQEHVTVALSGLGGDEIDGGYERYLGAILAEKNKHLLMLATNPLSKSLIDSLPDSSKGAHLPERLKRFVAHASLPLGERYFNFISKFSQSDLTKLFTRDSLMGHQVASGLEQYQAIWSGLKEHTPLRAIMGVDMKMYLPDDLLALSDRTSMAHSLEIRVPFVDPRVVDHFWKLPAKQKINGFSKKFLLKKLTERYVPKEIIYRKKKGFSVPLTVWFRQELRGFVEEILSKEALEGDGLFNPAYVQKLLDEHMQGKRNHDEKIFSLLAFSMWYRSLK